MKIINNQDLCLAPPFVSDMQGAPDIDPRLSSGASKLRKGKLDKLPWDHSGRHPGNPLFWKLILVMLSVGLSYIFRRRQKDSIPVFEGGRILAATHINGLVDPAMMISSQDRRVISMGRHDLMTMPLIGWFSRRMGSQPVIRRPEIASGVSDQEYAKKINDRTLLTMTNCIASGFNAVVMPEGKSHQDSHLHRLKTGPMRFALNASAIAKKKRTSSPAIQPVGLHFRCHHWFRTDVFVEFPDPIIVDPPDKPGLAQKLTSGVWEEPPSEQVNQLRNQLFESLSPLTPDAPDWETYRAWHLIGHIRANNHNSTLESFRDEVLSARDVRNSLSGRKDKDKLIQPSIEAAEILHSHDLDGRCIRGTGLSSEKPWTKAIIGLSLMAVTAPITIPSTGIQAFIAWYFGDRTDEGIDARTSFHMLAGMFSPVLFWPPLSVAIAIVAHPLSMVTPLISVALMISFHCANLIFLLGYDLWTDFTYSVRIARLDSSDKAERLRYLLSEIRSNLNLL